MTAESRQSKGADNLESFVADLNSDPRIDDAERCLIVGETGERMFTRPIRAQLQAATGCE